MWPTFFQTPAIQPAVQQGCYLLRAVNVFNTWCPLPCRANSLAFMGFSDTCHTLVTGQAGTGTRVYVNIILAGHYSKMFYKGRRDRDQLAEEKTEAVAKGRGSFLAGAFGKRTEISFSDKLDAWGERKGVCFSSDATPVWEKQTPSPANSSCWFCGRVEVHRNFFEVLVAVLQLLWGAFSSVLSISKGGIMALSSLQSDAVVRKRKCH